MIAEEAIFLLRSYCSCISLPSSIKAEDFKTLIQDELCLHLSSGHGVVMENLNFHKSMQVQQLITATGAKALYLPGYFPDFDSIAML